MSGFDRIQDAMVARMTQRPEDKEFAKGVLNEMKASTKAQNLNNASIVDERLEYWMKKRAEAATANIDTKPYDERIQYYQDFYKND